MSSVVGISSPDSNSSPVSSPIFQGLGLELNLANKDSDSTIDDSMTRHESANICHFFASFYQLIVITGHRHFESHVG